MRDYTKEQLHDMVRDLEHELHDTQRELAARVARGEKWEPSAATGQPRSCTCHPDDNPPVPCPQKFAYSECAEAAQAQAEESIGEVVGVTGSVGEMRVIRWRDGYSPAIGTKLYTHPQPARTFTDADIERAVRTHDSEDAAQKGEPDPWADEFPEPYRSERMTAMRLAIDAAMAKESGQ